MSKGSEKRKANDSDSADSEQEDLERSYEEGGIRLDDIYIPPPPRTVRNSDANVPRLIITKIENQFFKSYAEKQVIGPLHKCFNAVVGPNGSGKSNVIDAMLFVFGYRASKIRSKKLSVLLHKSEHYRNVESCTVSVHFAVIKDNIDDEDAYEIIPNSEFVISRTAKIDNSSYYQINDRRVQFKEVATLLREHGVDLDHNRFLILQGEVEQISLMKPKSENEHETGLLEYLEDIIGTSRFKKPLVQLQEREEMLTEQKCEKLNRVKLVENELKELKKPMEEAVGFLKLENAVTYSKSIIYQKNIQVLELKIEELNSSKEAEEKACNEVVEKLNKLRKLKDEKQEILNQGAKKYEGLEKRRDSLKEAFEKASSKDMQLQATMQQTNLKRKKTKELLAQERKKLQEYEQAPEKNLETIKECEAKEAELSAKKEKLEAEKLKVLSTLRAETQDLQDRKEVLQADLVQLNKVVADTKEPYTLAKSELKIYLSGEETESKKYENLREQYEKSEQLVDERARAVAELKKKIPTSEKSLQSAMEELNRIKNRETKLINSLRNKRAEVEESKSAMQASRSKGRVLDSLVQLKREGKCPGLFGRLGDLGAIDAEYDIAISTACGPLDNIVVDTVETAQRCIEFLKSHDIGRATFIALDKQEHLRERAITRIKTPENVPRLYDLVRVQDERVKPAFYYALRDTLVTKDLEQATRIAYGAQRFRVVTVQGDVIETSGTMSGGGRKLRGRMGQSINVSSNIDPKQVKKLESELLEQEKELSELRQRQVTLESEVQRLQPQVRQMKIDLEKFTLELKSLKEQLPHLAKQVQVQEAKMKSSKADKEQVKKLTQIVEQKKQEYEKAVASAEKVQTKVDKLTAEIKEKTIDKMKAMDKKIKEVATQNDKCKNEVVRLRVAIKTAQRNAVKSRDHIVSMEQDIKNAENSLKEMKAQRDEIEADAAKLLACIEEIVEKLGEGQEEYTDVKEEVAALTKQENQIRSDKIEVDQKLKTITKSINEHKAEIHGWRAKLSHLHLQDIPNENVEPLKTLTPEELDSINIENVKRDLHVNEKELKSVKPNLNAIEEYYKLQNVFMGRTKDLDEVSKKQTEVRDMLELVRTKRKEEFLAGYNLIRLKVKEMYQMITLGGDADIDMVDSFDPFTEGIQFNVRPPKKAWKMITNLSGGEKTLSSLALVFALHYYKPSPLYVMDEIDAALDFKNVSIIGNYIKERTKNAQFLVISLRPNMYELAHHLIGIYKTYNTTKTVTIDPRKSEEEMRGNNRDKNDEEQDQGQQDEQGAEQNEQDAEQFEQDTEQNEQDEERSSSSLSVENANDNDVVIDNSMGEEELD
ncbi:structural maintenance of chromosomes protein 4 [Agrilus planipennis]|uniref:Structural maintenance of chromosomes protein n=1 Tax=Agrilus planipennis TaxID=224129 RepID=A0A1W4WTU8_AGRPL|nr:structural maintenance of chromosomes protein 4 [Agrilus planipennis]